MAHYVTHPANVEALRKLLIRERAEVTWRMMDITPDDWPSLRSPSFDFVTNPHMDRDKPSGKYRILATGNVLAKDDFRLQEGRFIEYGPDDIPYLLMRGVIEELREPLFMFISDAMENFQIRAQLDFGVGFSNRPAFLYNNFA